MKKSNSQLSEIKSCVEEIIKNSDAPNLKPKQLIEIEREYYKPLIQQLAYKKDVEAMQNLGKIFEDLGYLNTKLWELTKDLKYCTDAAVLYQYVIAINHIQQNPENIYRALDKLKHNIISFAKPTGSIEAKKVEDETKEHKSILGKLREKCINDIKIIDEHLTKNEIESYVNQSQDTFKNIAKEMRLFLGKLYQDSEKELGKAPCNYAVIGLGSMALQQMTPYSDLEFAILTDNNEYKSSQDIHVREYFKNLTHLVHFKVINLGETIILTSKYEVDLSHLVHRGVNFDLGGKTPLGRSDKFYDLIGTVEEILWYVKNENDHSEHIDKALPFIMETSCHVYGDKEIFNDYNEAVLEFLNKENESGIPNRALRSLKLLQQGTIEFDYLKETPTSHAGLKGDLMEYEPLKGFEGSLFECKKEIYRIADRLIYNLGLYYGIKSDDQWNSIDQLKQQGIINTSGAYNLKFALSYGSYLRLKTYLYNEAQSEGLSAFKRKYILSTNDAIDKTGLSLNESRSNENSDKRLNIWKKYFSMSEHDTQVLIQYFYIVVPFHRALKLFCAETNHANRKNIFKEQNFYDTTEFTAGIIHLRLLNYTQAREHFKKLYEELKQMYMRYEKLNDLEWMNEASSVIKEVAILKMKEVTLIISDICLQLYHNIKNHSALSHNQNSFLDLSNAFVNMKIALDRLKSLIDFIKIEPKHSDLYIKYASLLIKSAQQKNKDPEDYGGKVSRNDNGTYKITTETNHDEYGSAFLILSKIRNYDENSSKLIFSNKNYGGLDERLQGIIVEKQKIISIPVKYYTYYLLITYYKEFKAYARSNIDFEASVNEVYKYFLRKDDYINAFLKFIQNNDDKQSQRQLEDIINGKNTLEQIQEESLHLVLQGSQKEVQLSEEELIDLAIQRSLEEHNNYELTLSGSMTTLN